MTAWLLTWVSQGLALVAVVAVVLRFVPRANGATRFAIWFGVLIALAWPGWTSSLPAVEQPIYVPSAPDRALSVFMGVWAAISLINLIRILPSLDAVYALRDRCRAFPRQLEARLPMWLEARDRGRRTELKICDAVAGATVLGFQRPCIAIPSALVAALTPVELDQIVLHEYAHVQRRDDWSRLAQALALSALWIHPAAHIVSRALNRHREMACDEWVVASTGLPKAYAKCLTHAAEVRGRMDGTPALLSAFLGTRHELVRRVDRLLKMHRPPRRRLSRSGLCGAIGAMAILSIQLQSVRFAEIADAVLPRVAEVTVRLKSDPTESSTESSTALSPGLSPGLSPALNTAIGHRMLPAPRASTFALTTQIATVDEPDAPVATLEARAFEPLYASTASSAPIAPYAPIAPNAPNRWSAPGVEIASAAKKTSVGVANVFSRAGVSLARSF